jgi:hypothetical protein
MPFEKPEERAKRYKETYKELNDAFAEWAAKGETIRDYLIPWRGVFEGDQPNQGDRKGLKILDPAGSQALKNYSAGIQAGLSSPARPWFKFRLTNPQARESAAGKQWAPLVEEIMYGVFQTTNFYTSSHIVYEEEGGFGTGNLITDEDPDTGLPVFKVQTYGTYRMSKNDKDIVDTHYSKIEMTARQIREKFPNNIPNDVENATDNQYFTVLRVIEPNSEQDPNKIDNLSMLFTHAYMMFDGETMLSISGFRENPIAAPTLYENAANVYGYGLGEEYLGHIKELQQNTKMLMKANQKMIDPPLIAPSGLKGELKNINIPGVVVTSNNLIADDIIKPVVLIKPDLGEMRQRVALIHSQLHTGFFNHLFQTLDQAVEKTAFEVGILKEEKRLLVGPMIGRQMKQFLQPVLERTFNMLLRNGIIPPPPEELEGVSAEFEFISTLAQAQRAIGAQGLFEYLGFVAEVSKFDPSAIDKVNTDETIDLYADMKSVPPGAVNSDEAVSAIRQQRAEAQAEAKKQAEAQQGLNQAEQLGNIDAENLGAIEEATIG